MKTCEMCGETYKYILDHGEQVCELARLRRDSRRLATAERERDEARENASVGGYWHRQFRVEQDKRQEAERERDEAWDTAVDACAARIVLMSAAWLPAAETVRALKRPTPAAPANDCEVDILSSRVCERGTRGCRVQHAAPASDKTCRGCGLEKAEHLNDGTDPCSGYDPGNGSPTAPAGDDAERVAREWIVRTDDTPQDILSLAALLRSERAKAKAEGREEMIREIVEWLREDMRELPGEYDKAGDKLADAIEAKFLREQGNADRVKHAERETRR